MTNDPELLRRLNAVGTNYTQTGGELQWASPAILRNDLAPLDLTLTAADEFDDVALRRLLDEVDAFAARVSAGELVSAFKQYIIQFFRQVYEPQLPDFELEELQDVQGVITDEAILGCVGSGNVVFEYAGDVWVCAYLSASFDEEHGVDIEFDEQGEIARPWQ